MVNLKNWNTLELKWIEVSENGIEKEVAEIQSFVMSSRPRVCRHVRISVLADHVGS